MSGNNELSRTGRIDLNQVVAELQHFRKSQIRKVVRGASLVEIFVEEVRALRSEGARPSAVVPSFLNQLGLPHDGAMAVAGARLSQLAEETSVQLNYHNSIHIVEVVLASYVLGKREKLPVWAIGELIVGAASHDLGHTGENNRFDYEREDYSAKMAEPVLRESGVDEPAIERIKRMILATDYKVGAPAARKHYLETRMLAPLDETRIAAGQCVLLTEADVLFSCFDLSYNELLSKLLSEEWKRPDSNLSLKERLDFLSSVHFISDASRQLGLEDRKQSLVGEIRKSLEGS
jgi:hypothetical protein